MFRNPTLKTALAVFVLLSLIGSSGVAGGNGNGKGAGQGNGPSVIVEKVKGNPNLIKTTRIYRIRPDVSKAKGGIPGPPAGGGNSAPKAVDDSATTDKDTPVVINVLANDSDPEGDAISLDSVTQGSNGSVADNGNGTVTYTPNAGYEGVDSFDYTISDTNGNSDSAQVTVTVGNPPCDHDNDGEGGSLLESWWSTDADSTQPNFVLYPKYSNLDEAVLLQTMQQSFDTWVTATSGKAPQASIVSRSASAKPPRTQRYDGENSILFQNKVGGHVTGDTLAVTITWTYTATNEIAEVDMVFNAASFDWTIIDPMYTGTHGVGDTDCGGTGSVFDLQNVATHEAGHAYGLGHTPNAVVHEEVTMYPYGIPLETRRRSLSVGDNTYINMKYPD